MDVFQCLHARPAVFKQVGVVVHLDEDVVPAAQRKNAFQIQVHAGKVPPRRGIEHRLPRRIEQAGEPFAAGPVEQRVFPVVSLGVAAAGNGGIAGYLLARIRPVGDVHIGQRPPDAVVVRLLGVAVLQHDDPAPGDLLDAGEYHLRDEDVEIVFQPRQTTFFHHEDRVFRIIEKSVGKGFQIAVPAVLNQEKSPGKAFRYVFYMPELEGVPSGEGNARGVFHGRSPKAVQLMGCFSEKRGEHRGVTRISSALKTSG